MTTKRRYTLEFDGNAQRPLRRVPGEVLRRLRAATDALCDDPRPRGAIKLSGSANHWRLRVGDFRILYQIDDDQLVVPVVRIAQRQGVYQDL